MQIARTLSCYHDDQLPELGGKSQEGSGRERKAGQAGCVCPPFTVCQVLDVFPFYTKVFPALRPENLVFKMLQNPQTEDFSIKFDWF